jgi:hypothetical protein
MLQALLGMLGPRLVPGLFLANISLGTQLLQFLFAFVLVSIAACCHGPLLSEQAARHVPATDPETKEAPF